jgi:hypothetical protein
MSSPKIVLAVIVVFAVCAASRAATAPCTFVTFNPPSGYTLSTVEGIGDNGTVAGQVVNNKTLAQEGFVRSPKGAFTIYAAPDSSVTWMYGHNGTDTSVGSYIDNSDKPTVHGFSLVGKTFTAVNYPSASNTWLFDVNKTGAAVGSYSGTGSSVYGFLLVNGQYTDVSYPNALSTYPIGVSDKGAVVGTYSSSAISNGFLWQNGKYTTINYPKMAPYGTALDGINNDGVIVGNRLLDDSSAGFIYEGGTFEDIVYPGAKFTLVGGINNNGVISGQIYLTVTKSIGYTATCK